MKGRWMLLVMVANVLVLVGLAFVYPAPMVGPGPVIPAHAAVASGCFACHAPFGGASPARCEVCHTLGEIGVRSTKGAPLGDAGRPPFHQELTEQDCIACHTDHLGRTLGQRSEKPFSHGLVRAATRERCEACHTAPRNDLHRALGVGCGQCHKTKGWKPATFEHDKFFQLDRKHAVACVTCHTESDYKRYTCYGCHEHTKDKLVAEHAEEGIRDIDNCVACHKSPNGEPNERGGGRGKKH
jgi:hypothetical protein